MVEDEMFAKALDIIGIKRTKDMYEKSKYPHRCNMCLEDMKMAGYKLKKEFVSGYETPYMFICQECWENLPSDKKKDI